MYNNSMYDGILTHLLRYITIHDECTITVWCNCKIFIVSVHFNANILWIRMEFTPPPYPRGGVKLRCNVINQIWTNIKG